MVVPEAKIAQKVQQWYFSRADRKVYEKKEDRTDDHGYEEAIPTFALAAQGNHDKT